MRIHLTKSQWARFSDIMGSFTSISIASIVIPALFDKLNIILLVLGIVAAVCFFYFSLLLAKKY